MNAGPDVERAISAWLAEEAPAHAPDRVLDDATHVILRTKQRRFAVAWREPMILTSARLLAAAAVIVIAVVGAGVLGRMTATTAAGAGSSGPAATPSSSVPGAATLESYRAGRNAICVRYAWQGDPLKSQLPGIYDSATSADQRTAKIAALTQFLQISESMTSELSLLDVPFELVKDHAADVAHYQDINLLIAQEIPLLAAGKLAQAQGVDQATDPLTVQISKFETRWGLSDCP